jgi:hypothetical protein
MLKSQALVLEDIQQEAISILGLRRCSARWRSSAALCIRNHVIAYFTPNTIDIRLTRAGIRGLPDDIRSVAIKERRDWIEFPINADHKLVLKLLSISKGYNLFR